MYAPPGAVPVVRIPTNQFLRGQAERDHCELQVEIVRLEPEEQIDAEDYGKRGEAENVRIAPRPAKQHVECIREEVVGRAMKGAEGVDRRPIPAPIQQYRALRTCLQVVLLPQSHLQPERPSAPPCVDEQRCVPGAQRDGRAQKRPQCFWVVTDGSAECKADETEGERKRKECLLFRRAGHKSPNRVLRS